MFCLRLTNKNLKMSNVCYRILFSLLVCVALVLSHLFYNGLLYSLLHNDMFFLLCLVDLNLCHQLVSSTSDTSRRLQHTVRIQTPVSSASGTCVFKHGLVLNNISLWHLCFFRSGDGVVTVNTPPFSESITEGDVRWEKGLCPGLFVWSRLWFSMSFPGRFCAGQ